MDVDIETFEAGRLYFAISRIATYMHACLLGGEPVYF